MRQHGSCVAILAPAGCSHSFAHLRFHSLHGMIEIIRRMKIGLHIGNCMQDRLATGAFARAGWPVRVSPPAGDYGKRSAGIERECIQMISNVVITALRQNLSPG